MKSASVSPRPQALLHWVFRHIDHRPAYHDWLHEILLISLVVMVLSQPTRRLGRHKRLFYATLVSVFFCSISTVTSSPASRWCRMNNSKESCAPVLQMFCLIESNYGSSSNGICRSKTKTEKHWKYFQFAMVQTISSEFEYHTECWWWFCRAGLNFIMARE